MEHDVCVFYLPSHVFCSGICALGDYQGVAYLVYEYSCQLSLHYRLKLEPVRWCFDSRPSINSS
ncbi:hypothetical protein BEI_2411 [Halomonas beimenensis]|uniref:Uncharacterized protein n=1 Tax=Halomonas beimenensis TaxID=475662 RepID=A0A291P957_9GAMM|nr:hypothetical protein BEI_2411 [Halomonas beimenensis]